MELRDATEDSRASFKNPWNCSRPGRPPRSLFSTRRTTRRSLCAILVAGRSIWLFIRNRLDARVVRDQMASVNTNHRALPSSVAGIKARKWSGRPLKSRQRDFWSGVELRTNSGRGRPGREQFTDFETTLPRVLCGIAQLQSGAAATKNCDEATIVILRRDPWTLGQGQERKGNCPGKIQVVNRRGMARRY